MKAENICCKMDSPQAEKIDKAFITETVMKKEAEWES